MSKLKYVNVRVERSEHLSIPDRVPEWVVGILAFIHGEEKVVVESEVVIEVKEVPNAAEEYDRLERCYGADVKTEKSFVSEIYGAPPRGINELAKAIADATVTEQAEDDPTA